MMMSGPVPDWIAEVMRAWIPFPPIVSTLSLMPSAFWHSSVISPEQLMGYRHKIDEFEPLKRGRLPVVGRPACGEYSGHSTDACRNRTGTRNFQKPTAI